MKNILKKNNRKFLIIFTYCLIICQGCLKDTINVPDSFSLESDAMLLKYLEEKADFLNDRNTTFLVDAGEVFVNLNKYLVIDIRTKDQFATGHIYNSINIANDKLFDYLSGINLNDFDKIVLVSTNGQSSAYYTSLLRLYGFPNIYSMNFGMAYWHYLFTEEWFKNIKDAPDITEYDSIAYSKAPFNELPDVFNNSGNVDEMVKERIRGFISKPFDNKISDLQSVNIDDKFYLICYGSPNLYLPHPVNARLYQEAFDLQSVNNLQTLPAGKDILIYDYNGQFGAAVTAYLIVLGYKARVLLFGACQLIYSYMLDPLDTRLQQYAFLPQRINNYPIVAGE